MWFVSTLKISCIFYKAMIINIQVCRFTVEGDFPSKLL